MDISQNKIAQKGFESIVDLTSNIDNPRYSLREFTLKKEESHNFLIKNHVVSIVVIEGGLEVINAEDGSVAFKLTRENGVHIWKGSIIRLKGMSKEVKLLVASADPALFEIVEGAPSDGAFNATLLSDYRVTKPWGFERWYTDNIKDQIPYALKLIGMNKGNRSSLQSHEQKSETNVVIEGTAEVLFGVEAPQDRTAVIDPATLTAKHYGPGEGWSNKIRELHRVVSFKTYKAVEISTPELDDVVRWQDDSGRKDGRIFSEHGES